MREKKVEGNKRTSLLYFIVQLFHNIILYWVLSVDPPIHAHSFIPFYKKQYNERGELIPDIKGPDTASYSVAFRNKDKKVRGRNREQVKSLPAA